jgi:hypothetical protein
LARPPPVDTGGYQYFIPAGLWLTLTVSGDFGNFLLPLLSPQGGERDHAIGSGEFYFLPLP